MLSTSEQVMQDTSSQENVNLQSTSPTIADFDVLSCVGLGTSSHVFAARSKRTNKLYALKAIWKSPTVGLPQGPSQKYIFNLQRSDGHPNLLPLLTCFQDKFHLYLLTPYHKRGDMYTLLRDTGGPLPLEQVRFFTAELTLALQWLHTRNIIHRDVHGEHVLLTADGHVQLTSYTRCKPDMPENGRTKSFCGTADFRAPEMLLDTEYGRAVDWWGLGVVAYQMLCFASPFEGSDEDELEDAILEENVEFPVDVDSDAVMLVAELLEKDPDVRLGSGRTDALETLNHPFFRSLDRAAMMMGSLKTPCTFDETEEVRHFPAYKSVKLRPGPRIADEQFPDDYQEQFKDFDFCHNRRL